MRNHAEVQAILKTIGESKNIKVDIKNASTKKEVLGAMVNAIIAETWKTKDKSLRAILQGLRLGYDIVDTYTTPLFEQTMLMYFSGVALATKCQSRQAKIALRVLEILDIEFCFDAVFPVGLGGLSFEMCKHTSVTDEKYNKPMI